jgi:hypothetical protein
VSDYQKIRLSKDEARRLAGIFIDLGWLATRDQSIHLTAIAEESLLAESYKLTTSSIYTLRFDPATARDRPFSIGPAGAEYETIDAYIAACHPDAQELIPEVMYAHGDMPADVRYFRCTSVIHLGDTYIRAVWEVPSRKNRDETADKKLTASSMDGQKSIPGTDLRADASLSRYGYLDSGLSQSHAPDCMDGWKLTDVIARLVELGTPAAGTQRHEHPMQNARQRIFGICQICEYSLMNCQCADGPY